MKHTVSHYMGNLMLFFVIYLVAASSFHGFFSKWAFRDKSPAASFSQMFDGDVSRPLVYRRLIPICVSAIDRAVPASLKDRISNGLEKVNPLGKVYARVSLPAHEYVLKYYLTYYICFLFFFAALFLLRRICIDVTGDPVAGTLAVLAFAVIFPLFETSGGYFYDFPEIFFFAFAVLCAWRGWWIPLLLVVPIAELNKETFLFLMVAAYPLLRRYKPRLFSASVVLAGVAIAGAVFCMVRYLHPADPGTGSAPFLYHQLAYIINPVNYFRIELNYGFPTGKGLFFLHIACIAVIVSFAWSKLDLLWKRHIILVTAINLPLFLLFCNPGELRNLSMLYITLILSLTIYLSDRIKKALR